MSVGWKGVSDLGIGRWKDDWDVVVTWVRGEMVKKLKTAPR